jgi:hypothetical protein
MYLLKSFIKIWNRGNLKDAIFEKIPVHKNFNKELLTKSVGDEDIDEVPSINNNATDEIIQ